MAKTLHSARHRRLAELLSERRKASGMTQADVAKALGRHQPFVANIENGDRRVDLIELIDLALIIDFELDEIVEELRSMPTALVKQTK